MYGGGERYPLELGKALTEFVDCRLVVFGPRRGVLDNNGLRIETLRPLLHLKGHPAHPIAPGLRRALDRADVIHTHHLRSAPSRLAGVFGRLGGRGLAVTDHGLGGRGWGGLLPRLFDRFLVVSRYSAHALRIPESKTRVVYGGADTGRFTPVPKARRSGVLFVGRITPHKGIDRLIKALPARARLTLAGTGGHDAKGPERGYGRLLAELSDGKDVRSVGRIPDKSLPHLYRTAKVFVLPSVHLTCYGKWVAIPELLGLSLLEAMASGTPVVCSRVGGLPEVVVDGETGFVVEPGDIGAMHDRLAELLSNARLAKNLGDNARDHVAGRFTWRHCAERCADAYGELSKGAE
jgi:glycosyltransferase involved in cell wall biosynthesis